MTSPQTANDLDVEAAERAALGPDIDRLLEQGHRHLADIAPELPVKFTFAWRGIDFIGHVHELDDELELRLYGDVGPLPFSSERPGARRRLLLLTRRSENDGAVRFAVTRRQRVGVLGQIGVEVPVTCGSIVVAATRLLLGLGPWLELALEEIPRGGRAAARRGSVSSGAAE